ncbi:hypothetical protein [Mucilaginibacter sp. BT774]|uniref:hypothetical protein n=1 Tax=Mucilaginibacter sp. BT774 TaxID=3062276 RepID=UPI0026756424|nr:hypothetical protein [Mucilaginibacter sp. BT774]MDO3627545.1 hypothetical protein [Mucilaginibacter sp. BT774]
MDGELNIAPRETDYLDDYDGPPAIYFYELKSQLADLGFTDSTLKILRTELMRGKPDLTLYWPMRRQTMETYFLNINQNQMNTENLSYLQKQLLNLGFGEKLNEDLEKNIKSGKKEFTLATGQEYNKQYVDYTLHFKAGDQNDMYFFNSYDASLPDKQMQQTFYINKGSGITAKEAYNLMEGRAVHKQLENLEGEKYHAWIVIDKENKTENGNYKLRPFTEGWNYKPERTIDKLDIVGIDEEGAREKLMKSLEKGNRHQVTAMKDGKEVKLYLEANPAEHRVNLTNWKGEAQQLEHYKKPEFKNDHKKDQKQTQEQEADDNGTKKKRGRNNKMTI